MHRRLFFALGGLLAALPMLRAQSAEPAHRSGWLRLGADPIATHFWEAMGESGWVEGKNIEVENRFANSIEQLSELAADLVRSRVDVILTDSTPATRAARKASPTIPIVFVVGADPVESGLVASLNQPDGNVTGFVYGLYEEKMLEILREPLPKAVRVAKPGGEPPAQLRRAAEKLRFDLRVIDVQNLDDFSTRFFPAARAASAEAVLLPNIPWLNPGLEWIGRGSTAAQLPGIGWIRSFPRGGGLLSYGPTPTQHWWRMAHQVNRLLRGSKPAQLPVETPTRFDFVINVKSANELGITVPQSAAAARNRSDPVIERVASQLTVSA